MRLQSERLRRTVVAAAVVALLAGGGVAYATSGGSDDSGSSGATSTQAQQPAQPQASGGMPGLNGFAAALAEKLGVETSKVEAALDAARQSATSRDDFVATLASELGLDQAKVEAALADLGPPGGQGGPGGPGHGGPGMGLDAAATYLGLTEAQLQTELQSGKTLAEVAKAHGKSVDGLVAAMVADLTDHLKQAVAAGDLTQSEADRIAADAKARITEMVQNAGPGACDGMPGGFGPPDGMGSPDGTGPPDGTEPGGTSTQSDSTSL